jgi:hypothetical protein
MPCAGREWLSGGFSNATASARSARELAVMWPWCGLFSLDKEMKKAKTIFNPLS